MQQDLQKAVFGRDGREGGAIVIKFLIGDVVEESGGVVEDFEVTGQVAGYDEGI